MKFHFITKSLFILQWSAILGCIYLLVIFALQLKYENLFVGCICAIISFSCYAMNFNYKTSFGIEMKEAAEKLAVYRETMSRGERRKADQDAVKQDFKKMDN